MPFPDRKLLADPEGQRHPRARSREGGASGVRFARIVGVICMLLLAAYVVAVWAMTAKPD